QCQRRDGEDGQLPAAVLLEYRPMQRRPDPDGGRGDHAQERGRDRPDAEAKRFGQIGLDALRFVLIHGASRVTGTADLAMRGRRVARRYALFARCYRWSMAGATNTAIRFKAKLSRPANPKGATWMFLVLPAAASAKLPTRSMVT